MGHTTNDLTEKSQWNLFPLTPKYLEAEHGCYVSALETALEDDRNKNIALSGSYGVGKSSILRELGKRFPGHVVELSLSTLAPIEASKVDDSVPVQATTQTNRIQQEIVKQLLYRAHPEKTPASRFRRIHRFQWPREILIAALSGLLAAFVFLTTGWTTQITAAFRIQNNRVLFALLVVCGVTIPVVYISRWLLYGKVHIKQFSAGTATVTLEDKSVSYFDQYLDEIVYFFEVSGYDVVIFEDIDRFNDSYIFEALRALNTLLNASPQIKKPIRFIYAIKDSIFDQIELEEEGRKLERQVNETGDPAEAEVVRANRTKFFDLIIPVVPFITHTSSRNLAVQLLSKIEHAVEVELLDLAAQYVPDMRLLKNICNEFIVFRDRIFSGDGAQLNLNESDLFAIMLYKNTHLKDFEMIRLGKSKLDDLYTQSRIFIAENIERIDQECRELQDRIKRNEDVVTKCVQMGDRLFGHLERRRNSTGYAHLDWVIEFNEESVSVNDLKTLQFWRRFVEAEGEPEITYGPSRHTSKFRITRPYLEEDLGFSFDFEEWEESFSDIANKEIKKKIELIEYLRSADFKDLLKSSEFWIDCAGVEQSFVSLAEKTLESRLAYRLMEAGYLNRNFTLYTATFHGDRVGSAAMSFIIHHVERDAMDPYFVLTPEDVDAVVRERSVSSLKEPALYNIAILDHLLGTKIDLADGMIESLGSLGERQRKFLRAYLNNGTHYLRFVERFVKTSPEVLIYLVNEAALDDPRRLELVNAALANISSPTQRLDSVVIDYLQAHYSELLALTDEQLDTTQAERVGQLFSDANIKIKWLNSLSDNVREAFVSRSLYEINRENLTIVLGKDKSMALDAIRSEDRTIYNHVLNNIDSYLNATEGYSATIDTCESFVEILDDIIPEVSDDSLLDVLNEKFENRPGFPLATVIERAAPECRVVDLSQISGRVWPLLAWNKRFPATFNNVNEYIQTIPIYPHLSPLLNEAGVITEVSAVKEEDKHLLAKQILLAKDEWLPAAVRVELVESLKLDMALDVRAIQVEEGDLFALLLKRHIIPDTVESFEYLEDANWRTRELFIRESRNFIKYMTPELIEPDLKAILISVVIDDEIKRQIIANCENYAEVAGQEELEIMARLAVQFGQSIPVTVLKLMAQSEVPSQYVVALLQLHLGTLENDELIDILDSLGSDYSELITVGSNVLQFPNTPANRELLEYLKTDGVVSSCKVKGKTINVYRKRK